MTGLSPAHLEQIRDGLAAGRRPRVVFTHSAGQMAGQVGQVVALTDPTASEEWVVVRFGRDELPFSPVDLQPPSRARRAQPVAPAGMVTASNGTTRNGHAGNGTPSNGTASNGTAGNGRASKARASTVRASGRGAGKAHPGSGRPIGVSGAAVRSTGDSSADTASRDTASPDTASPAPGAARPARPRPPKQPAALAVTVAYADGAWTVAASLGSRTISRAQPIRAADALRLVAMLDAPAVRDAVEHIIAAERSAAEQRAQRLRTELAELETRLAELRDAR